MAAFIMYGYDDVTHEILFLQVVNELRLGAERQELSTLFFAESPTKVLYYLEVAHSLLMPAQSAQECNEFQVSFCCLFSHHVYIC